MNWFNALIAGIIQGLTEFLPVSSSGHLVIYGELFGKGDGGHLAFTVFLHFATLLSVLIVFYKDVWMLITEFFSALSDIIKGKPNFKTPERRFLLMVIIGTIPAVVAGLLIKVTGLDEILENIFVVAFMLVVTAVLMFCVDRMGNGKYTEVNSPFKAPWIVGGIQAIAILPGLSRSGSTIFGGLLGGFKKEFAVRFAFILSIPAILGAGLIELLGVIKEGNLGMNPAELAIGFIAAMVSGVVAIGFIKMLIKNNRFYIFGIYCLIASIFAFLVGFGVIQF